jgi:hypothetical protein
VNTRVSGAVEGAIDEAVLATVAEHVGFDLGVCHVNDGIRRLLTRLPGFNAAAEFEPWVVLADLDGGLSGRCAGDFLATHLPNPAQFMYFRLAVQQVEAWLLADRAALAAFLSVREAHIPPDPDGCVNAKDAMVNVARRSRRRVIREGMVPKEGSGRSVGAGYTSLMIEFSLYHWRPDRAQISSASLARSLARLAAI